MREEYTSPTLTIQHVFFEDTFSAGSNEVIITRVVEQWDELPPVERDIPW